MKINPYAPNEAIFNRALQNANNISNNINKVIGDNNSDSTDDTNKLSFADTLKNSLDAVNSKQVKADNLTQSFTRGDEGVDITDVMLGTAEANLSLQYAVQVRNKLVDAYQEITKMQI